MIYFYTITELIKIIYLEGVDIIINYMRKSVGIQT